VCVCVCVCLSVCVCVCVSVSVSVSVVQLCDKKVVLALIKAQGQAKRQDRSLAPLAAFP